MAIPLADITITSTATLVASDDPMRKCLSCTNTSSSVAVRWGDATVTASKGQRIDAGATVTITDSGPIYMISEGLDVTLSRTEERK